MTELCWNCVRLHFLPSGRKGVGDRNSTPGSKMKSQCLTCQSTWWEHSCWLDPKAPDDKIIKRVCGGRSGLVTTLEAPTAPRTGHSAEDRVGECGWPCATSTHPLLDVFSSLGSCSGIRDGAATSTKSLVDLQDLEQRHCASVEGFPACAL